MQPAVLVRLRPSGPWRFGPGEGGRQSIDALYRSDRLYSALTLAFGDLGYLEPWLEATARAAESEVRIGSFFPYQADTLFAIPPSTIWPPPPPLLTSPSPVFLSKLRWAHARFVPVTLIQSLVLGRPVLADQWVVDAESECLLRRDRPSFSPFRHVTRRRAPVDRIGHSSAAADTIACVEFEATSGLWAAITFASADAESKWSEPLRGAFRLLADSGFGAGRKIGWGQTAQPEFERGSWPNLLLPKVNSRNGNTESGESLYWLLSLYSPAATDRVNWTAGDYRILNRGGRVESRGAPGTTKKIARLIHEGSVISCASNPTGRAVDVAPDGFAHPVYRAGFALAIRLPEPSALPEPVAAEEEIPCAPPEEMAEPVLERPVEEPFGHAAETASSDEPADTEVITTSEEQPTAPIEPTPKVMPEQAAESTEELRPERTPESNGTDYEI